MNSTIKAAGRWRGRIVATETDRKRLARGGSLLDRVLSVPVWVIPVVVLVLGPLVLEATYVFYRWGAKWPEGTMERDLWFFWSATYGDLFFLPVIALLIALGYRNLADTNMEFTQSKWGWVGWLPAASAVVGTTLLTVAGFTNADNANWTQPIGPGWLGLTLHLNLAGWIHATFFVVMLWWLAEFTLRLIIVLAGMLRKHEALGSERAEALTALVVKVNGILLIGTAFGVLLVRDYWEQISTLPFSQTWFWFIAPAGSFFAAGIVDAVLLNWLRFTVPVDAEQPLGTIRRGIASIVLTWLIPSVVLSVAAIALTMNPLFSSVHWMVLAPVALAVLASVNVWSEVYWFQNRRSSRFGWIVVVAAGLTMLAAFFVALLHIAQHPPVESLEAIVWPFLAALAIDALGCMLAVGMGFGLARYEWFETDYQAKLVDSGLRGTCFGAETPEHDIVQNPPMYAFLFALLPLVVVGYEVLGWPIISSLDSSSQISLLFGYSGFAATIIAFPLYNNMAHVRRLEDETKQRIADRAVDQDSENSSVAGNSADLRGPEVMRVGGQPLAARAAEDDIINYLNADKNFSSFQTVATGVLAIVVAMSLWITIIDRVATNASLEAAKQLAPITSVPTGSEMPQSQ